MEASFWHNKWATNEIAFHESEINLFLKQCFSELSVKKEARVFLPLCGKTKDISWLLSQGYKVVGAELSDIAIAQLFIDLNQTPHISTCGELTLYQAQGIDIYVGDIFKLTAEMLGQVDAIYDRAALVALPAETRKQYTQHLIRITQSAPQLMICFEYDQEAMAGPPFSIPEEEVMQHYQSTYRLKRAAHEEVPGGLKGKTQALEIAWLLEKPNE